MAEGLLAALLGILGAVSRVFFKELLLSDDGFTGRFSLLLGVDFDGPDLLSNPCLSLVCAPFHLIGQRRTLPRHSLEVVLQAVPLLPVSTGHPVCLVVEIPKAELIPEGLVPVGREEG